MNFLLDTCVISELLKRKPNPGVEAWISQTEESSLFLSVLTIGEFKKGLAKLHESQKKETLEVWMRKDLLIRFEGRVLPVSEPIASKWGSLAGNAERNGHNIPVIDGLIAATALIHDLKMVTRNVLDFQETGVEIMNPWK